MSVLGVLRHLNYEPWFALAEFVDNSLQSALDYRADLRKQDGRTYVLRVSIDYDPLDGGRIVIRDNAAGIHDADYDRAFKTAERPPSVGNLAEFGMGLKSAACWFASKWSVRSKALGEREERYVEFDIDSIVDHSVAELSVGVTSRGQDEHYTEVTLTGLHHAIQGRTVGKIKAHLAAIYRYFSDEGFLELRYKGEELKYIEPRILKAPYYRERNGQKRMWRREFDIDLGDKRRIFGFAALRETASVSEAGFALFRRRRLIQGGADEGYRPERIFKKANSFIYQRLIGDIHVEGFGVSHTKDAIQWDGREEAVLDRLAKELDKSPLPLLDQAQNYRASPPKPDLRQATETALNQVASVGKNLASDLAVLRLPQRDQEPPAVLKPAPKPFTREFELEVVPGQDWTVTVEATDDPTVGDWLSIADRPQTQKDPSRHLMIRIALAHPFMVRFGGPNSESLEALIRIGVGLALAETSARDAGVKFAGSVRSRLNTLLRGSLAEQA